MGHFDVDQCNEDSSFPFAARRDGRLALTSTELYSVGRFLILQNRRQGHGTRFFLAVNIFKKAVNISRRAMFCRQIIFIIFNFFWPSIFRAVLCCADEFFFGKSFMELICDQ